MEVLRAGQIIAVGANAAIITYLIWPIGTLTLIENPIPGFRAPSETYLKELYKQHHEADQNYYLNGRYAEW